MDENGKSPHLTLSFDRFLALTRILDDLWNADVTYKEPISMARILLLREDISLRLRAGAHYLIAHDDDACLEDRIKHAKIAVHLCEAGRMIGMDVGETNVHYPQKLVDQALQLIGECEEMLAEMDSLNSGGNHDDQEPKSVTAEPDTVKPTKNTEGSVLSAEDGMTVHTPPSPGSTIDFEFRPTHRRLRKTIATKYRRAKP